MCIQPPFPDLTVHIGGKQRELIQATTLAHCSPSLFFPACCCSTPCYGIAGIFSACGRPGVAKPEPVNSLNSTKQRHCLLLWIRCCTRRPPRHYSLKANCNVILDHVKSLVWDGADTEQPLCKIFTVSIWTHQERLTGIDFYDTATHKNTTITTH